MRSLLRPAIAALVAIALLSGCDVDQGRVGSQVVCTGRDGSTIQSSVQDYWWLRDKSDVYYANAGSSFQPRPGDECRIQEVYR